MQASFYITEYSYVYIYKCRKQIISLFNWRGVVETGEAANS